ncbi:unnamed protein product [Prunus brigantina]
MMHNSCATMQKCGAHDYKQIKAYVGKEDMRYSKGLLGMVKGERPKLAKSWLSVNCVCLPFNLQRQKHWILLVVDLKECEIRAYDSKVDLCRTQAIQRAVQPVAKMLPQLLKESGYIGDGLLLKSEWPIIRVMDAHQQVGGGSCGMHILKYCEFLTSNVDLAKISHDAMPFYLLKLAVQLLQGYCGVWRHGNAPRVAEPFSRYFMEGNVVTTNQGDFDGSWEYAPDYPRSPPPPLPLPTSFASEGESDDPAMEINKMKNKLEHNSSLKREAENSCPKKKAHSRGFSYDRGGCYVRIFEHPQRRRQPRPGKVHGFQRRF